MICMVRYSQPEDGQAQRKVVRKVVDTTCIKVAIGLLHELADQVRNLEGALIIDRGVIRDIF